MFTEEQMQEAVLAAFKFGSVCGDCTASRITLEDGYSELRLQAKFFEEFEVWAAQITGLDF